MRLFIHLDGKLSIQVGKNGYALFYGLWQVDSKGGVEAGVYHALIRQNHAVVVLFSDAKEHSFDN